MESQQTKKISSTIAAPVPEPEETQEEMTSNLNNEEEDGNQVDDDDVSDDESSESNAPTFYSPEAGAARLEQIPKEVMIVLNLQSIWASFNTLIDEVKARCDAMRKPTGLVDHERNGQVDYERMWTRIVFQNCIDFSHIHRQRNILEQSPVDLVNYFKKTNILVMLQILIDLSQQNGLRAMKTVQGYNRQREENKIVSHHDYEDAKSRSAGSQQLYHDFVDLYRKCIGTRAPSKTKQVKRNQQFHQKRDTNRNHESMPQKEVFRKKVPFRPDTMDRREQTGRKNYQPGNYPMHDDQYQNFQRAPRVEYGTRQQNGGFRNPRQQVQYSNGY